MTRLDIRRRGSHSFACDSGRKMSTSPARSQRWLPLGRAQLQRVYTGSTKRLARPSTTMLRAALLLCGVAVARAQIDIGDLPAAGQCDLATLSPRVAALQSQCCAQGGTGCTCDVACSSELLPLLDDCRPILNIMLDTDDGSRDGVAGQLDALRTQCLAIDPADVLAELRTLHDAGTCSDGELNNVASTPVGPASCVDTNEHCKALVAAGIQCEEAPMDTGCLDTCGYCGADSKKFTVPDGTTCAACLDADLADWCWKDGNCYTTGPNPFNPCSGDQCTSTSAFSLCDCTSCDDPACLARRRAQIAPTCSLDHFSDEAAAVNTACCDYAGCNGVPNTCDAKCAIVFDDFYERCSNILDDMIPADQRPQYAQLHRTCSQDLPVEPLLRAVIACQAAGASPCASQPCQNGGTCTDVPEKPGGPSGPPGPDYLCTCAVNPMTGQPTHWGAHCETSEDDCTLERDPCLAQPGTTCTDCARMVNAQANPACPMGYTCRAASPGSTA